jgi:hypothetical protein
MRTVAVAAVTIAVLAGPALAQQTKSPMQLEQELAKRNRDDIDKAYNAAPQRKLQNDPNQKPDPWGSVRTVQPEKKKK